MIQGIVDVVLIIVIAWIVIFLMECMSTDLISTLLGVIPLLFSFMILTFFLPDLPKSLHFLISLLLIIDGLMITINILKEILF
jgi:hypothetical protein